ncbi:hydrogenase iron-sulfur subunit [Phosphitispora sp. TUW77]|uniref:hydrogenase iron-sulfur subunit n=1 Tax=Phosphitispora sp. TUW77 TaxID=3152361 RepID=UPI003AB8E856
MNSSNPLVLLLMCSNSKDMLEKLLPKVQLRFPKNVKVMAVSCPSELDPLVYIRLLRKSCDGLIVACSKNACSSPEKKVIMKRREILKDILPIFGLHREQFKITSVSSFNDEQLFQIIEDMIEFLGIEFHNRTECNFIGAEGAIFSMSGWIN